MTGLDQRDCEQIEDLLDFYIDRELPAPDMDRVSEHIAVCVECRRAAEQMTEFRLRLRRVARSTPVPAGLEARMMATAHRADVARFRNPKLIAVAAAALLTVAAIGYQLTAAGAAGRHDSYIAKLAGEAAPVIRVGLKDHMHCAVFRNFAAKTQSFPEMTRKLGPEYADLLPVLERQVPPGMKVFMAHQCRAEGRLYVHLIARNNGHLISLIVARREDGEAFESDLRAVMKDSSGSLYSAGVREFAIAGFETQRHLVYLISDSDQTHNMRMMQAMSEEVRAVLLRSEG